MATSTVRIIGKVLLPGGSPALGGYVKARLSRTGSAIDGAASATVLGGGGGGGVFPVTAPIGQDGSVDFYLTPNDAITPSGTHYVVEIVALLDAEKRSYKPPAEKWQLASSPGTIDIGAAPRLDVVPGIAVTTHEAVQAGVLAAATASKDAAAASAGSADAARVVAETARDAALAIGKIYPDTTAGLAATAEGSYFNVPAALSGETFILYRKVAGAAVEVKRYLAQLALGIVAGKNKFDPAAVTVGFEVYSTGAISAEANSVVSDFIDVQGQTQIALSGLPVLVTSPKRYVFLGVDKSTIVSFASVSAGATSAILAVPAGAYYFRISPRQRTAGADYSLVQIEMGGVTTAFEAYSPRVLTLNAKPLGPVSLAASDVTAVPQKNKFDASSVTEGYEVYSNGTVLAEANSAISDFIDVRGQAHVTLSGLPANPGFVNRYYVFLAADKTTILSNGPMTSVTSKTLAVPAGAYWLRFSPRQRTTAPPSYGAVQVEHGGAVTAYEAFQKRVSAIAGIPVATGAAAGWSGLRYLLFGDSITETATVLDDGTYTEGLRANWPDSFRSFVSAAAVVNYAKSGAAYRDRTGLASEWQKVSYQITKAIEHGKIADVVIVAAGTNDGATLLGDYTTAMGKATLADLDRTLLYEALRWAFWQIRTSWPLATCFAVLPIQRADATPESHVTMYDAIRSTAQRYNFVVIDALNESGIVRDFEVNGGAGRDLSDGLHPNTSGQAKMGKLIAARVRSALNF
jgi:lysophospholipase L1-like esterase